MKSSNVPAPTLPLTNIPIVLGTWWPSARREPDPIHCRSDPILDTLDNAGEETILLLIFQTELFSSLKALRFIRISNSYSWRYLYLQIMMRRLTCSNMGLLYLEIALALRQSLPPLLAHFRSSAIRYIQKINQSRKGFGMLVRERTSTIAHWLFYSLRSRSDDIGNSHPLPTPCCWSAQNDCLLDSTVARSGFSGR